MRNVCSVVELLIKFNSPMGAVHGTPLDVTNWCTETLEPKTLHCRGLVGCTQFMVTSRGTSHRSPKNGMCLTSITIILGYKISPSAAETRVVRACH